MVKKLVIIIHPKNVEEKKEVSSTFTCDFAVWSLLMIQYHSNYLYFLRSWGSNKSSITASTSSVSHMNLVLPNPLICSALITCLHERCKPGWEIIFTIVSLYLISCHKWVSPKVKTSILNLTLYCNFDSAQIMQIACDLSERNGV